jgi:hypothetical protein
MEALRAPSEVILSDLAPCFNPLTTSDAMVEYLAHWVDLSWVLDQSSQDALESGRSSEPFSSGIGRLRELVAASASLARERGTRDGIVRFLEIATGTKGFRIAEEVRDSRGGIVPFHVRIQAPPGVGAHRRLIQRIIEMEKPAHVTYELTFDGGTSDQEN